MRWQASRCSWVLVALVGWLGACGESKPVPPAGSGIVRPVVDEALPPDFTFRWPSPAEATVTLRIGQDAATMVSRGKLTLGPPDERGRRLLRQSEFEAVGGKAAELVAVGLTMAMREAEVLIERDGTTVDPEAGALWAILVETWLGFSELGVGEDSTTPEGSDGVPVGVEFVARRRVSNWDDAVQLGYRMTALSPRGQEGLQRLLNLRGRQVPRWYDVEAEIDPRTMQPIQVTVKVELEGGKGFGMIFEVDWSGGAQRHNQDTR